MAGGYAHLTMVTIAGSPAEITGLGGLDKPTVGPLLSYSKYMQLGAVSPDYPYLHLGNKASARWADTMHYNRTGDRLKKGAECVREMDGEDKYKALAWLLGFASHIITDVSIHPVVELKTGPYADDPKAHRVCEMHQDVFIFNRLNMGAILGDAFIRNGLSACNAPGTPGLLHPLIVHLWGRMLKHTDEVQYSESNPTFQEWHRGFHRMLGVAGQGRLIPFARHMVAEQGLVYPEKPDDTYIKQLRVPGGSHMDYADIFDKAHDNVRHYWGLLVRFCLKDGGEDLSSICNWNLDTGRDETGRITMWE